MALAGYPIPLAPPFNRRGQFFKEDRAVAIRLQHKSNSAARAYDTKVFLGQPSQ